MYFELIPDKSLYNPCCTLIFDTRHFRYKADVQYTHVKEEQKNNNRKFASFQKLATLFCSQHIGCDPEDRYVIIIIFFYH